MTTTSTVKQPKLSDSSRDLLTNLIVVFSIVAFFSLGLLLVSHGASDNREKDIAAYEAELASVQATNTPVFEKYADDLEQYGVSLSAREYERLFYSGEEFVESINGEPKQLSVSFGSSGEPAYLLADGAVLAEVERAPAVRLSKDAEYRSHGASPFAKLTSDDDK